ncbi:MAG: hypothetical protein WC761_00325 [Candidatus Paceibacterota bacterium]|jgi:hypothetical protein
MTLYRAKKDIGATAVSIDTESGLLKPNFDTDIIRIEVGEVVQLMGHLSYGFMPHSYFLYAGPGSDSRPMFIGMPVYKVEYYFEHIVVE